jgi:hypothetical protein
MLTAKRAFAGDDVTETIANIVKADPEWAALPPDLPRAVRTLLQRCLAKDPRQRVADFSIVRYVLADANDAGAASTPTGIRRERYRTAGVWPALLAGALVVIAVLLVPIWRGRHRASLESAPESVSTSARPPMRPSMVSRCHPMGGGSCFPRRIGSGSAHSAKPRLRRFPAPIRRVCRSGRPTAAQLPLPLQDVYIGWTAMGGRRNC